MMKKLLNNRGITLASLAIAVIIILILTGTLIYNVKDNLKVTNLREMQNDIQNLRDAVSNYYSINGSIPAKLKYINTDNINRIKDAGVINEKADTGEFYIIDLKELENLTLNYGEDYKHISDATSEEEASQYTDIYIINEESQNIFYVEGIRVDNDWFYTDYTSEDVDEQKVNLRYVDGVKIPDGFYYVGGTKEEGIVISDNIEDMNEGTSYEVAKTLQGNQFVWVPVENDADFQRYAGYVNGKLQDISSYTEPYTSGYENEEVEYNEMKKSVLKYNGFYVGRYEASNNGGKAESKQGKQVWNKIAWGTSMTDIGTTGAVYKSQQMYTDKEKYGVTSTLIYGVQWDAIMQWIDPEYKNEDGKLYEKNSFVANSTDKGNYSGSVAPTGSNENYAVKNIYDLAGNVCEWMAEANTTGNRVIRGGDYSREGSKSPVSSRGYDSANNTSHANYGFRVALYLNIETYDEEKGVNAPQLKDNMELVKYDEINKEWVTDETNSEYSYKEQAGSTTNRGTSEWANAKVTIDGVDSYFVWIPRYAYKINSTNKTIDIKFIKNTANIAADGTVCKYADDPTLNTATDYIIHPAFTTNADLGGGWDTELSGIWIGKYESARSNSNGTTQGTSDKIKVQPNVTSWRNITIGDAYTNSLNYSQDLKSHMLKNSEWGAVAYLTHSKYGRNGTEVTINNNSNYLTGNAGDSISATASATTNAYNTEKGVLASSTGNVYGIYDISGGAHEYVAAYYNGSTNLTEGNSFASQNGASDMYATVYMGTTLSSAYKYGDATYEVKGWNGDTGDFISSTYPFFKRGGQYDSISTSGIFFTEGFFRQAYDRLTFRISLVTE